MFYLFISHSKDFHELISITSTNQKSRNYYLAVNTINKTISVKYVKYRIYIASNSFQVNYLRRTLGVCVWIFIYMCMCVRARVEGRREREILFGETG